MITFGINLTTDAMREFLLNNVAIMESVGIINDHVHGVGEVFPWMEAKCREALGLKADTSLFASAYFGQESNCYWCTYTYSEPSAFKDWRYGVVFDVVDDNKAILLKLAMS